MSEHKLYEFDWNLSWFPILLGFEMTLVASVVSFTYINGLCDVGNIILLCMLSLMYLLYAGPLRADGS